MVQAVLEQTGTVLEQTSLLLDSLAVSRFDHAWLQALSVNIRLGWKGTDSLAYLAPF